VVGRNGGVVVGGTKGRWEFFAGGDDDVFLVAFALDLRFNVGEEATGGNVTDF